VVSVTGRLEFDVDWEDATKDGGGGVRWQNIAVHGCLVEFPMVPVGRERAVDRE